MRVRIATYNIHGAVGTDGRCDPARIAAVLAELDADVVALQEVHAGAAGVDLLAHLRAALGVETVSGPTLLRADAEYGNALISRHPVRGVSRIDLSVGRREPRGALDTLLDAGAGLRVLATHLGLWPGERRRQVKRLLQALDDGPALPTVLLGDLNEWYLWGRTLRWLHAEFERSPAPATFPAPRPFLALDRLWARPRRMLEHVAVHASPLARRASDHLPLVATLALPAATVAAREGMDVAS
jgi:endonuclease/exonuclease/phosphatase family metal-dependent hydrolase